MQPLDPNLLSEWQRRSARKRRERRESPRPTATSDDRRADPRFPLANTEIRGHAADGRVLDLARGGMAIETNSALRPGHRYTFTLSIGEYVETVEARVLWCRLRATERRPNGDVLPVYRAGIERVRRSAQSR